MFSAMRLVGVVNLAISTWFNVIHSKFDGKWILNLTEHWDVNLKI